LGSKARNAHLTNLSKYTQNGKVMRTQWESNLHNSLVWCKQYMQFEH